MPPAIPALFPPSLAVSFLLASQQRNLDALAAAQRATVEGLGTLVRQQGEILLARWQEVADLPAWLPGADLGAALARPFDALRDAILEGTAQRSLLAETAARAGAEVAGILQDRLLAALEETKAALQQAVPARA